MTVVKELITLEREFVEIFGKKDKLYLYNDGIHLSSRNIICNYKLYCILYIVNYKISGLYKTTVNKQIQ